MFSEFCTFFPFVAFFRRVLPSAPVGNCLIIVCLSFVYLFSLLVYHLFLRNFFGVLLCGFLPSAPGDNCNGSSFNSERRWYLASFIYSKWCSWWWFCSCWIISIVGSNDKKDRAVDVFSLQKHWPILGSIFVASPKYLIRKILIWNILVWLKIAQNTFAQILGVA